VPWPDSIQRRRNRSGGVRRRLVGVATAASSAAGQRKQPCSRVQYGASRMPAGGRGRSGLSLDKYLPFKNQGKTRSRSSLAVASAVQVL
jgi:hypothetical protein